MADVPRMSSAKAKVLECLLSEPGEPHYGYQLMRETGVKSGSLYPILEQLERVGWLVSRWEPIEENQAGRPPRRWYRLTAEGERVAPGVLANFPSAQASGPGAAWRPGLAT